MTFYTRCMTILLKRTFYRWRRKQVISRLRADGDDACSALAAALQHASSSGPMGEEKRRIDAIESVRRELSESTDLIPIAGLRESRAEGVAPKRPSACTEEYKTVGEICSRASSPAPWAYLLFRIITELRPIRCLELGTACGISAAYQAAALDMNERGTVVTIEGFAPLAAIAEKTFARLAADQVILKRGKFEEILAGVLEEYSPIGFAFIDGHHDEQATVRYFTEILPHLSDGAVLVFDDIAWSDGMQQAWRRIASDPRVAVSIDLFKLGICATRSSPLGRKRSYKAAFA